MSDGQITFSTALDNSQLEKDLKDADRKVDSLKKKVEKASDEKTALEQDMERGQKAIAETDAKLEKLNQRMRELEATDLADSTAYFRAQKEIEVVKGRINETTAQLDKQLDEQVKIEKKWQGVDSQVKQYSKELETAQARQKELGVEYAKSYKDGSASFYSSMSSMEKRFGAFTSKITNRIKRLFVFSFIFSALASLKKYLTGAVGENDRFAASIENLKAVMRGFAAPAVALLARILTEIVNVIAAMIITLARLVDSIFQTNIVQSIQEAQEAARIAWDASEATDEQAAATQRLAKAQKEAVKWLAAFDELNMINANNSEDVADELGDSVPGAAESAKPDWDALDVGKISTKLSEIMIIIGAALMAVGAILAFSGINIPLGLTLMAIGALMVYTAASENWDKLPAETREAISKALVITGIVLVVLGAILAFSGANIPLGIGVMIAGLVLIYTAAALNWKDLPDSVKTAITGTLVVIGIVAVVLGAVLAFSGANVPLGIGLIIFGVLSLVTAAALNWEWLTNNMGAILDGLKKWLAPVGIVAIVVGAILIFTGVGTGVGIALIAAGAAALIASIALNWDWLTNNVDTILSTLKKWLAPVGIIAIVLGVILVFTGVGVGVGIALIAAGAVALITSVVLNWGWLTSNMGGILEELKKWLAPAGIVAIVLGVILVFTGVGVGVGIALILAGAAMLIAAIALNWEWLSSNIETILGELKKWLVPIGIVAIVLGAILLFTGVGTGIGIALIAAGAAALIASVVLNWKWLSGKIDSLLDKFKKWLAPAGAVAIVLGIILLFTGVGIGFGVALIALGVAAVVAAVALNWESFSRNIDSVLTTLKNWLTPIGIIAIVLGVILCVTGVGIPIGLALIVAGVAVTAATLDWNSLKNGVEGVIEGLKDFLIPVGLIAIVLGVILCVTGVMLPLGVALIVLGAGSLVAAVVTNWDAITDKIKEVWGNITQWWKGNVAKIFTAEWWADLFGSIGQGLLDALTGAASAFHDFIVGICDNIGGAFTMLGQSWSYDIPTISLPALATGAVIPPNSEFLAVLGDQKRGRNIEAPEDLIRQIVRDEAGDKLATSLTTALMQVLPMMQQGQQSQGDAVMVLRVGNEELARAVNKGDASLMRRGMIQPEISFA